MCFRPDSVGGVNTCPECGQLNPSIATNCIKCGAELPNGKGDGTEPVDYPEVAKPTAPTVPTSPSAPVAPGAPK